MYARRSRLSARKQMDLLGMFVARATAGATAEIVGVHRNTDHRPHATATLICCELLCVKLHGEIDG